MDDILILDTETATLEKGVVEIAWVDIDDDLRVLSETQSLINPECPISPQAAGVHHITEDMVADKPTLGEFMESKGRPYDGHTVLMIGHNVGFDVRHVDGHFGTIEQMDTLKLSRIVFKDAPDHKLQTLMYYLNLRKKGTHNALDDVYTVYDLLTRLMNETGENLEGLYHLAKKPVMIEKMPFGKHKDTPLQKVPRGYVSWLLKQDNVDENLRWSFKQLGLS